VFSEGVQHRLRFCLDHFNCVKMAAFHFYLQSVKQRKVGCLTTDAFAGFCLTDSNELFFVVILVL
jgi:hypothetical protein